MNLEHLPIPESDLLDYIEGKLPGSRRVEVAGVLRKHPELAAVVAAMQDDRRLMTNLPAVLAPAGLLERVEAQMEREALLGLSGRQAATMLPVSAIVPERPSVIGRIWRTPAGRRLAAAAGLAIVGGAGVWGIVSSLPSGGHGGNRIARVPEQPAVPAPGDDTTDHGDAITDRAGMPPDGASPEAGRTGEALPETKIAGAPGAADDGAPGKAASEENSPDPTRVTAARALELARQGRLAIIVRCTDTALAAKRIERLATMTKSDGERSRLHKLDLTALPAPMTAIASLWSPRPLTPAPMDNQNPATVATASGHGAPTGTERARPVPTLPAALYTIEINDEESALAALRPALATSGDTGPRIVVEFIKLDDAIEPGPSLDPAAILWWGSPPARWTWRWSVPVLVEPRP